MSEANIARILWDVAAQEISDDADLWPTIRDRIQGARAPHHHDNPPAGDTMRSEVRIHPATPPPADSARPRGRRWLRQGTEIAAAGMVLVLVAGLLIAVLGGRSNGPPNMNDAALGDSGTPTPTSPMPPADAPWSRYQLVFEANRDLYRIDADGDNLCRLTQDSNLDTSARWSPDGDQIAFTRHFSRPGGDTYDIYVMNADGTNLRNLTNHPDRDTKPAWSPDGTQIAFVSDRGILSSIYAIAADGSNMRRLTEPLYDVSSPRWLPDGQRIAFRKSSQIFVMNADGSEVRNLMPGGISDGIRWGASWSPDGQRFVSVSSDGNGEWLTSIAADGSGRLRLADDDSHLVYPTWSPTGEWIAFYRSARYDVEDVGEGLTDHQLYLVAPDGSNLHHVPVPRGFKGPMHWSPDGQAVSFTNGSPDQQEAALHVVEIASGKVYAVPVPGLQQRPNEAIWSPKPVARTEPSCRNPVAYLQPPEPTADEAARLEERRTELEGVVAALRPAGLVFEIGQDVTIHERTVRLERLIVDRDVVYVDYEFLGAWAQFQLAVSVGDISLGPVFAESDRFAESDHLELRRLRRSFDPSATTATIRVLPYERDSSELEPVEVVVPIDLSPLRSLPEPKRIEAVMTGNGVRVETGRFTRGVQVSTLELTVTLIDPAAVVPAESQPDPNASYSALEDALEITAMAAGQPVPVLGLSELDGHGDRRRATVQLLGVPEEGELQVTVEAINVGTDRLREAGVTGVGSLMTTITGPWTVSLTVDQ